MGRRPNALILHYFDRGAKLQDASNRYKHTCKSCGQEFPKGRIETLTTHLMKKCPVLSIAERTAIVLQIHDLSSPAPSSDPVDDRTSSPVDRSIIVPTFRSSPPTYNGLNVLAEASRRVGASVNAGTIANPQGSVLDPSIGNDADGLTFLNLEAMATHPNSEVPSIVTSAHDILPITPELHPTLGPTLPESLFVSPGVEHPLGPTLASYPPPQPNAAAEEEPTHFVAESGTDKPPKPKTRAKFSTERRKEVDQVRKIGACLRCRMLRKNCSVGQPCQACNAIGIPRVWKLQCLRTRLANEITLFSISLHTILATRKMVTVKRTAAPQPNKTEIELSILCGVESLRLQIDGVAYSNPWSQQPEAFQCFMLNTEQADTAGKVDAFLQNNLRAFCNLEKSPLVKTTVDLLYTHSSADHGLANVLSLWTTVSLLMQPQQSWRITVDNLSIDANTYSESCAVTVMQIRSLIEKRTASLAKLVITEVERRLVRNQKQPSQQFLTFLTILMLLNCVERMGWIFQQWEYAPPGIWPLDRSPTDYAGEAENFTSIIESLLEIRAYAPRLVLDPQRQILTPKGPACEQAREWFNNIAITPEYITFRREQPFDPRDCNSNDGRYFSRLFRS